MNRTVRKTELQSAFDHGSGAEPGATSSPLVSPFLLDTTATMSAATNVLPSGVSALASIVPSDAVGARIGAGGQVLFNVTYSGGTTASSDSILLLSNQTFATLVSGAGTATAVYSYAVTANDPATSDLIVDGVLNNGSLQACSVDALIAIVPTMTSPNDTYYSGEWYLNDTYGTHADAVWPDYTGKGVTVAVFDNGIEYAHPDLGNVDVGKGYDPETGGRNGDGVTKNGDATQEPNSGDGNFHGTSVSGLIAAGRNGFGTVGTAYDAGLYAIFYDYATSGDVANNNKMVGGAFTDAGAHADIINDSWGTSGAFYNSFVTDSQPAATALQASATSGRHGLGTVVVQSAGNDGAKYADTNMSNYANSRFSIVVGASSPAGSQYTFSTNGASILVSAPGGAEITTDRLGSSGYNTVGDYTDSAASQFYGTSGSAPVTSGVIALMLQANPNLGQRDVQEILAYAAQPSRVPASYRPYLSNGAGNWNNGGLRYNNVVGFGIIDALAAVRLAETWQTQKTWGNVVSQTVSGDPGITANLTAAGTISSTTTLHIARDQTVDRVDLYVDISATLTNLVSVILTSPDGTVSTLLDRIGTASNSNTSKLSISGGTGAGIHYTLDSTQFMGEHAAGDWTITLKDTSVSNTTNTVKLTHASLTVYGDAASANSTYYYTNAYANAYHGTTLTDSDGGYDTINAAAVTSASVIDLSHVSSSTIGGTALTIADYHVVDVFGGDGDDTITANDYNDTLCGGRGNDTLTAGTGVCLLQGGRGNDILRGGNTGLAIGDFSGAFANYTLTQTSANNWSIADTIGTDGTDTTSGVFVTVFSDGAYLLNRSGTTTELFGADAKIALEQTGLVITDSAADISANIAAVAGLLASAPANALSYIASIGFTDAAARLSLTDADYQAFLDINDTFVGDYVTVHTLDDGSTATSDWTGTVRHHTRYADADGNVTSVETYNITGGRYDETISYYDTTGRRTQIDFLVHGDLRIRDQIAADGSRERSTYYNENDFAQEDRYYDPAGDVIKIVKSGYVNGPFAAMTSYYSNNTLIERLTTGYTGTNYSARDVRFGPPQIGSASLGTGPNGKLGVFPIQSQTFLDYGNAGTSFTLQYDGEGHVTEADYDALVGRSYTDLTRTYDTSTGFVTKDVFENYGTTQGETLTTLYGADGKRTEYIFEGLTGRSYTGLDRRYSGDLIMTETRTGFSGTDYSSSTTYYNNAGVIDHTSYALDAGGNRIVGTTGNDILQGAGGDTLVGRLGADRFVIGASNETVQDFSRKQGDLLDLSSYLDNPAGGDFLGTAAFDGSHNAVRYDIQGANAFVSVDLDGDKSADLTFTVNNAASLKVTDFLFA